MKLKVSTAIIINFFLSFSHASDFFVRGELGMPVYRKVTGDLTSTPKYTLTGEIGAGFQSTKQTSIEIGTGYLSYNTKFSGSNISHTVRSKYALMNVYYRTESFDSSRLVYFIKGGCGLAANTLDSQTKNSFAYQIGAGLEYKISDKAGVIGDISWLGSGKFKLNNSSLQLKNIIIALGFKYNL